VALNRCSDGLYSHTLVAVELSNEPNLFFMNFGHELRAELLGQDFCRWQAGMCSLICDV
jgi:hypothetical protein